MTAKKSALWIDGLLYCSIAGFGYMQVFLSSDEIFKYVNPYTVFFAQFWVGLLAAVTGALKMYRSTAYADHRKEDVDKEHEVKGQVATTTVTKKETTEKVDNTKV